MLRCRRPAVTCLLSILTFAAPAAAQVGQELRWGGDAEGGAPFVEADPADPDRVVGFDVDVAALVAADLGLVPRFVQTGFTTLDAAVSRGDVDIGLGGVEDSPARRSRLAVTVPYYQFREVLTVRAADRARYHTFADLRGRRAGTLAGTLAHDLLQRAARTYGLAVVTYEDDVHPYEDLVNGRIDAVVLDQVLAQRATRRHAGLVNQPTDVGVGAYVGVLAAGREPLRDRIDATLRRAMRDGRLEAIFRRWGVWNADQPRLFARVLSATAQPAAAVPVTTTWGSVGAYLPALVRASAITLALSCGSMLLAVVAGAAIATGRLYGGPLLRTSLAVYVEVVRGTPLLLQLFVIYFGLASFIRLPALAAAVLGLGLNYAAYESEIQRSALAAVPPGQLEAARTLGLTTVQAFVHVRAPQALRLALAPMTNDFVALLKDSSLVSVITVVELTKQTSILATNLGSWLVPGLVCAALYLMMSLPLATLARRLERRWRHG